MPITPTYPGVYIEELPSGVRTITGVATSITAFIGRALRGPTNEPRRIASFGDFQRVFGGLWLKSSLGFAVRDFYANGGSEAVVVRLYRPEPDPEQPAGEEPQRFLRRRATLDIDGLGLEARYDGAWGNNLRARIEYSPSSIAEDAAEVLELEQTDLFNLLVRDTETRDTEQFQNVTVADSSRRVDRVLESESRLVRVQRQDGGEPILPQNPPAEHPPPTQPDPPIPRNRRDVWSDPDPNVPGDQPTNTKVERGGIASDGLSLNDDDFTGGTTEADKEGLFALEKTDLFNLLCIPPYQDPPVDDLDVSTGLISAAAGYCEKRRAMLLVDPPRNWHTVEDVEGDPTADPPTGVAGVGTRSKNAALFFPRLRQPNPLRNNYVEDFVPSGAIAGVFARTDAQRGVFKAPAGLEAGLANVRQLSVPLTDPENGRLNPKGVNSLRALPAAAGQVVVWGARTLQGDDRLASEWKYIPIRRLALYMEESLYRGTQWVVFEPNDEPLWAQIRLNVGAFMHNLFRQGAFQGVSPREAYFVKCDGETTTQNDRNLGIVNILVGFAPLKPAEFVIIKIQQIAGEIET
jgi:phage tail sheath protein FI